VGGQRKAPPAPERHNVPLVNVPTIIVTGPVGVGKTTVAEEMGLLLLNAKVPHATVDFDQLTACYPRPADDDRWGTKLGLMNLAALWKNYARSGARRLLIARVLESRSDLDGFREAVPGADILIVRLRAAPETLQTRVRQRGPGRGIEWHLHRAVELAPLMDAQHVEDVLIETDGRDALNIARDILLRVAWLIE
jgi:adenylylsulfate kinase